MTSTRLPGKVLKTVLGKPLLAYFIERLRRVSLADQIVIATTINATDDPIVDLCRQLSVGFTRGSEEDVLARYYDAAVVTKADIIVRVTSDCPLIEPSVVDEAISHFQRHSPDFDYVSNALTGCFPRGLDVEVFSFAALRDAFLEATKQPEREHVTPFFYTHPERFRLGEIHASSDLSQHRWTVDTPEDFELIKRIIEKLYPLKPGFNLADILDTLAVHSDWPLINASIRQKSLGQ